jgi:serine/threonine protein kinase
MDRRPLARILIAEDYDDLREMITDLLRKEDHIVEPFADGSAVVEALKARQFDLIVLDWELPGVFGIDILKQFRQGGGITPILMLTGKKEIQDKEAGFTAGADDYLTKPFYPAELSHRVKALLRRSAPLPVLPPTDSLVGSQFAQKYEMLSILGRGGAGVIYKARHMFLNRQLAVKVMHAQLIFDAETQSRFRNEAQAISALNHKNIIGVQDFGVSQEGLPYIVMDLHEGTNLGELIAQNHKLEPKRVVEIACQACDALFHSHQRGVIHRDVKPTNILLCKGENGEEIVKLADFGIAKITQIDGGPEITQSGDLLGSPLYMSPEQCKGTKVDGRTDIYSLGCVIFTALGGKEPFSGDSIMDMMYRRTVEPPPPLSKSFPDLPLPPGLEEIVLKAMARDPDARFQTADQLKDALVGLSL